MPLAIRCLAVSIAFACAPACAQAPAKNPTMQQVLDASKPGDWRSPDPRDPL